MFAEELDRLAALYPLSPVVTISHSHGGNVVAWASTAVAKPLSAAVYLNTPFIQVLRSSPGASVVLQAVLWFGGAVMIFPLGLTVLDRFPQAVRESLASFVILFGSGIAALLVLLKYVPARIQRIRRSLHDVSTGVRRISRELVVFVVGDEPAAALGAVYFGQWLMRRMSLVLIAAVFALPFLARVVPDVISETRADQIGPWIIGIIFAFGFASLIIAGSGYGFVHGLVALDSPVTVTPAPIGHADVITVGWTPKQRLRHSVIHGSADAGRTIANWVASTLEPAS